MGVLPIGGTRGTIVTTSDAEVSRFSRGTDMKTPAWLAAAIAFLCFGVGWSLDALLPTAKAGELGSGLSGCDLTRSGLMGCQWKPKTCYEPYRPSMAYVYDVDSYNFEVDAYNRYVAEAEAYLACITSEAKVDITKRFPAIVRESVESISNDVSLSISNAKSSLSRSRDFIRR